MKLGVVLAGLLLAGTASAQKEQWLQYRTRNEGRSYHWLDTTTNAPAGLALPELKAKPYFARWKTPLDASGERLACFDRTRKSGPYNRVFFDSNGDGRLEDEQPVDARRIDQYSAYFEPIKAVFKGPDGPISYHVIFRFSIYDDDRPQLLISSAGWYEGQVNFDGKKVRLQLTDGNVNGTFNDQSDDPYSSDRVSVEGDKADDRFLGRYLEFDGKLFQIEAARDGAFVKVQKADNVPYGPVRVPETITEFAAFGTNGHFIRKPEKGEFTLPAGKYRIQGWDIVRKDEKGASWELSGYRFGEPSAFVVEADKPVSLKVGEPARGLMEIEERATNRIDFNLTLVGSYGEMISVQKGGQRAPGPKLVVSALDGSTRYTNTFEYG